MLRTSKCYSITQPWDGLGIQTKIEKPTKTIFLWKARAVLANVSAIRLCALGMCMILKSWNFPWISDSSPSFVEKLGRDDGSRIIEMISWKSVPNFWHVVWWSIFSMDQIRASNSECKCDNRLPFFRNPRSCCFPNRLAIPNHTHYIVIPKTMIHLPNKYSGYDLCIFVYAMVVMHFLKFFS